jgi:hypothetical protein
MARRNVVHLAVALLCACDSPSSADGLGAVALADSTDATGKADALGGRLVQPNVTEERLLVGTTDTGTAKVVELDDESMTVEAPLVRFAPQSESLQITVESTDVGATTVLRFLLAYRTDAESDYEFLVLDGNAEFEGPTDVDAQTGGRPTALSLSYFQSVSILAGEANSITVSSDESGGQTTSVLPFEAARAEWAVFVIPVDSGWAPLQDAFDYQLTASCGGQGCGDAPTPTPPADAFAQARDVTLETITIDGPAPESYTRANVSGGFNLGGTEFWQRWPGGHSPSFSYNAGTERGRACMQASAIRFEAIMSNPPPSMTQLLDETNWTGSFFNWNDDYTEATSGDASGAVLWAWRTGLIKWISQTQKDGTCHLPTLDVVERAAAACLAKGASNDGEIEGCSAR